MSTEPLRDATASEEWCRDTIGKLFGWSAAALLIFVGWLLSHSENELFDFALEGRKRDAAIGLSVLGALTCVIWVAAVIAIRRKVRSSHPTLPTSRELAMAAIAFCLIAIGRVDDPPRNALGIAARAA